MEALRGAFTSALALALALAAGCSGQQKRLHWSWMDEWLPAWLHDWLVARHLLALRALWARATQFQPARLARQMGIQCVLGLQPTRWRLSGASAARWLVAPDSIGRSQGAVCCSCRYRRRRRRRRSACGLSTTCCRSTIPASKLELKLKLKSSQGGPVAGLDPRAPGPLGVRARLSRPAELSRAERVCLMLGRSPLVELTVGRPAGGISCFERAAN